MVKFAEKLRQFFGLKKPVSEELFEELADLLVEGDFGPAEAFSTVDRLRAACKKQDISGAEDLRRLLADILTADLLALNGGMERPEFSPSASGCPSRLSVILLLGVNGAGKTTSAAKLAARYRDQGARPILAAADTFRAAAVDQLKLHGERLGIRVVAHRQGGDPAAVVYDALDAALAGGGDLIVADTAGRMHTKSALM
jgi:fused signal recognition particle receptor